MKFGLLDLIVRLCGVAVAATLIYPFTSLWIKGYTYILEPSKPVLIIETFALAAMITLMLINIFRH